MRIFLISLYFFSTLIILDAQKPEDTEVWEPEPKQISLDITNVPSDAIRLFDGRSLEHWTSEDGAPAQWLIQEDGSFQVKPGAGAIETKEAFGDCQLHIEWKSPEIIKGEGQGRGNSGLFLQKRYEVQILDSYKNRTYSNGQAGSVYKQYIPLVNAMRPSGQWQTYDVIFKAPVFNEKGEKTESGQLTVLHNGVVIQNNITLLGTSEYIGPPKNMPHREAPIMLQDHGDLVSFRNIWVRRL